MAGILSFLDDNDATSSDSDDDTYMTNDSQSHSNDEGSSISDDKTTSSDDDDDDDLYDDPDFPPPEIPDPLDPAAPLPPADPDDEEDDDDDDDSGPPHTDDTAEHIPVIDAAEGPPAATDECESDNSSDAISLEPPPTENECFKATEEAGHTAVDLKDGEQRISTRKKTSTHDSAFQYLLIRLLHNQSHHNIFLTAQMSANKELRQFGQKGDDALMKELQQLIYRKVMHPRDANTLSQNEKKSALKYLMFLKEKRCSKVKGCRCTNGRKQCLYKSKEEMSSPTIWVESLFLSSMIDAKENRKVMTCDIPSAFMQANIYEQLFLKFDGDLVELLVQVGPMHQLYIMYEGRQPVLYTKLDKALYGTLQAMLLFWQKLSAFLIEKHGFEQNE